MVDDLKQQASELYREQSQNGKIPTSDSLSIKKMVYISLGLVAVLLLVVQISGGFKSNTDAVIAANTPPPLEKEAPPPELLAPEPPAPEPQPAVTPAPAPPVETKVETPRPKAEARPPAKEKPAVKAAPAAPGAKPVLQRDPQPAPPPVPEISEQELARRELARDLVIRKSSGLAQLIVRPGNQAWKAVPEGEDTYQIAFSIRDDANGQTAEYIWRVNLTTASITPLSYHARRLP